MKTAITGKILTELTRFDNPENTFFRNKIVTTNYNGEQVVVHCYYSPKTEEETKELLENMKKDETITLFGNLTESQHFYNGEWYTYYTMCVYSFIPINK